MTTFVLLALSTGPVLLQIRLALLLIRLIGAQVVSVARATALGRTLSAVAALIVDINLRYGVAG